MGNKNSTPQVNEGIEGPPPLAPAAPPPGPTLVTRSRCCCFSETDSSDSQPTKLLSPLKKPGSFECTHEVTGRYFELVSLKNVNATWDLEFDDVIRVEHRRMFRTLVENKKSKGVKVEVAIPLIQNLSVHGAFTFDVSTLSRTHQEAKSTVMTERRQRMRQKIICTLNTRVWVYQLRVDHQCMLIQLPKLLVVNAPLTEEQMVQKTIIKYTISTNWASCVPLLKVMQDTRPYSQNKNAWKEIRNCLIQTGGQGTRWRIYALMKKIQSMDQPVGNQAQWTELRSQCAEATGYLIKGEDQRALALFLGALREFVPESGSNKAEWERIHAAAAPVLNLINSQ